MKRKPQNPALSELKAMLPFFIAVNAVLLVGCLVYGAFEGFSWKTPVSILLGNAVCAANFWLIGKSALSALERRNNKKAQMFANASYGMRYIGIFVIFAAGLLLGIIEIIPAFAPLFIPKIYYTFTGIFRKESND